MFINKIVVLFFLFLSTACVSVPPQTSRSQETVVPADKLVPLPQHETIAKLVGQFIQKTHYLELANNEQLSSNVYDQYLTVLDADRIYLRLDDVRNLKNSDFQFYDVFEPKSLNPAFEIFEMYRSRVRERSNFALAQLEIEPDYSQPETYWFDRTDQAWLKDLKQVNEFWRKRVKFDAMNLNLSGKSWPEAQSILRQRYTRLQKQMDESTSWDVFAMFMNALTASIDPHSRYTPPLQPDDFIRHVETSHIGVGLSLQVDSGYATVFRIEPGGPAAADGQLGRNDKIVAISQGNDADPVDVVGLELGEVVNLIRGPADTDVCLHVLPSGKILGTQERAICLTRGEIDKDGGRATGRVVAAPVADRKSAIGVIKIPSFYRETRLLNDGSRDDVSTTADVHRIITELQAQDIDGLIVDLRDNGGGFFEEVTALAALFIDDGPVVQVRSGPKSISVVDRPGHVRHVVYDGPLAILVNRNTAGASEIFAAAIQDYSRGLIIGQNTFGMGTVQNSYVLDEYVHNPDHASLGKLTLTVGTVYRVTGVGIQVRGVEPDIHLPSQVDARQVGEEFHKFTIPWDSVPAVEFETSNVYSDTIGLLKNKHISRAESDTRYRHIMLEQQETESPRIVSLTIGKHLTENVDDIELSDLRELALEHASIIVADMASLMTGKTRY